MKEWKLIQNQEILKTSIENNKLLETQSITKKILQYLVGNLRNMLTKKEKERNEKYEQYKRKEEITPGIKIPDYWKFLY